MTGSLALPRLTALLWRLPVAAIVATVVSLAVQKGIDRLGLSAQHSNAAADALRNFGCAALLAALLALVFLPRRSMWWSASAFAVLSTLASLALALLLTGSPFYLFGLSGDQFFRTQYLTRLTESPWPADGNYADLPAFYPAGWFWLGGRFANLLGLSGWAAYKPWAITTMAVTPVLAFVLWNVVLPRSIALVLAVLSCLACLRLAAYEPYSAILAACMVPVTVIVWFGLLATARHSRFLWSTAILGGGFLGICSAVYPLFAGFFLLVLIVLGGCAIVSRTHARIPLPEAVGRTTGWLGLACVVATPITLLSWGPYLVTSIGKPSAGNPAARFLPESGAALPVPMTEFSVTGVVCLLGVGWILWQWPVNRIAQALGVLVLACYAWYLVSTLALAARTTLLAFRLEPVVVTGFLSAGGLGGWHLVRWLSRRAPDYRPAVTRAAFVLGMVSTVSLIQTMPSALRQAVTPRLFDAAHSAYDDTGHRPDGGRDTAETGAWHGEVIATIAGLTQRPASDLVILTSHYPLLAFRPYRGFQTSMAVYANPLAHYDERRRTIESWAQQPDAPALLSALDNSPFAPPRVFVFSRSDDGLHVSVSRDMFPREADFHDVVFPEKLFAHPSFARRDVGPFTVIVRRP